MTSRPESEGPRGNLDILLGAVTVLYMVVIFHFSGQGTVSQPSVLEGIPVIDKIEHLFEYMVLSLLMFSTFHIGRWSTGRTHDWLLAMVGSIAYACVDELHQLFVPGREVSLLDLLADTAGTTLGVFLCISAIDLQSSYKLRDGGFIPLKGSMRDAEE